jgi:hypothetical protein
MTIGLPPIPPGCIPPETPTITPQDIEAVIQEKLPEALTLWALRQMGKQRDAYIKQAMRSFNTRVGLSWELEPQHKRSLGRLMEIVQKTVLVIPPKISDQKFVPENLLEIYDRYEWALEQITQWKKIKGQTNVRARRLIDLLPGLQYEDAWRWAHKKKKEASIIARDYIAKSYGFPSGETVKKQIALIKQSKKFLLRLWEQMAREAGIEILSRPRQKPKN